MQWLARPERRALGGSAAVLAGAVVAVTVAPALAGLPGIWAGLLTPVPAALVAAAVFGTVAPVPAHGP